MKIKKMLIIILLLFESFNLYAEFFVVSSNPYSNSETSYEYNDIESSEAIFKIKGTVFTIYRTNVNESISYSIPNISEGIALKTDDTLTRQVFTGLRTVNGGPYGIVWGSSSTFIYSNLTNPSATSYDFKYNTKDPSGAIGTFIQSTSRGTLTLPVGIPDSTFLSGYFELEMNHLSPYKSNLLMRVPIYIKLITVPNIQVISQNINFGKLDTGINSDKVAYGAFQINQNNANNNFSINYPTTTNLINTTDGTSVPMNIDMLYGSVSGPSVGNNFNVPSSTNSLNLYLKATLPGSSIYNKSSGTYTGSVTVNVILN